MRSLPSCALTLLALAGCQSEPESVDNRAPVAIDVPALAVSDLAIDAASAPRHGPLIAGEKVRVGLNIHGGHPPYAVELQSSPGSADAAAISSTIAVSPSEPSAPGVELAAHTIIAAHAPSARHQLEARVTDADGNVQTTSIAMQIIGEGAPTSPPPRTATFIDITDAGGRRRQSFVRGETLTLRAALGRPGDDVQVSIHDNKRRELARAQPRGVNERGERVMTFVVPRLARPGDYTISARSAQRRVRRQLRISGDPFPALARLTIDKLDIYGGKDGRAVRAGRLRRGETIFVEARIGGGKRYVNATITLGDGEASALARAPIDDPSPDARLILSGHWRLPSNIPAGRHLLQVEVVEGQDVATRYREVTID